MSKFKIGQKVYVPIWGTWGIVDGFSGCKGYDSENFFGADNGITVFREGGNNSEWMYLREVEKFIEPKFEVGDVIYCYPSSLKEKNMRGTCEIVKFALNKKMKAYTYMAFDKDGYPYVFQEADVVLKKKESNYFCKCPTVELKLSEICKLLGKNVKIIK